MSFFRYPGGKGKISGRIVEKLNQLIPSADFEYREPFFGGGSIGLSFMKNPKVKNIWINDRDEALADLWTYVIRRPEELKEKVNQFEPSVEKFYKYKKQLLENYLANISEAGFKKLVVHQLSYSGLGTKSGGPLGGKKQQSKYKIACRWSPDYICSKINSYHALFSKKNIRYGYCTFFNSFSIIKDSFCPALLYLDPPYFKKGKSMYQHYFELPEHVFLSGLLKETKHSWVLSYDDCDEIRELYSWAKIEEFDITYNIKNSRKKKELLICKK